MGTGTIGLLIWILFFVLHFFATQRLYSTKHFYKILVLMLLLSLTIFILLDKRYPELKFQFSAFLIFHYGILLLMIKLSYRKINLSFIRNHWITTTFAGKDFTYVTHAYQGLGDDIWEKKYASKPSWLDYIFSYCLLFVPVLLMLLTMWIIRGS